MASVVKKISSTSFCFRSLLSTTSQLVYDIGSERRKSKSKKYGNNSLSINNKEEIEVALRKAKNKKATDLVAYEHLNRIPDRTRKYWIEDYRNKRKSKKASSRRMP